MTESLYIFLCFVLFSPIISVVVATQFETEVGVVGKATKGRLGNLYNLRNKLNRSPLILSSSSSSNGHSDQYVSTGRRIHSQPSQQKESRGYAFHHSPVDIKNPMFTQGYSSRDFHSRMGKVSESGSKWKSPEKNMDKYLKYAYQIDSESSWKSGGGNGPPLNSFNIHQLELKNGTGNENHKAKVKTVSTLISGPIHRNSHTTTSTTTTTTTSTTPTPTTTKSFLLSSGVDLSPIKAIGQGLNSAMTTVLTQKLMGIIDQEVPVNFLNPLKHLVSSGQRMVEFWDKRANARDGKAPGIVEMFGYGIEQLKKYRDGQSMLPSDPVANITSASKTVIEGMMVVKKLTNRVLGYDTEDRSVVESRGGYDHGGGWGWGHHMSYGNYLDPYAILATLGFGVFLFNVIFNLLNNAPNNNLNSQRSLDVSDIDIPLALSDIVSPDGDFKDKIFGTPTIRTKRSVNDEDSQMFNSVIDKLDGMYKTYKIISGNPSCGRLYLCRAAIQDTARDDENSLFSQLYSLGLGQFSGDAGSISFMKSVKHRVSNGEDVDCDSEVKGCTE